MEVILIATSGIGQAKATIIEFVAVESKQSVIVTPREVIFLV